MKAYFDDGGNLVIEADNATEKAALHLWTYQLAEDGTTVRDALEMRLFGLRTPYVSSIKSASDAGGKK